MAAPRVVVIGAGPAGTRAAEILVAAGLVPTVVDEGRYSGGQIYRRQPGGFSRPARALYGLETGKAQAVHRSFDDLAARIDYRPGSLAYAIYDRDVFVCRDGALQKIGFDALILAPGATDRIMPLLGWTRPGVYSLGGAQIALKYQACGIGRRIVLMGTGPLLYLVAYQYTKAGAEIAAVLDTAPAAAARRALAALLAAPGTLAKGIYYVTWLRARGVPIRTGITPLAIEGNPAVAAIAYQDSRGTARRIDCDAVAIGYGLRSESQLADLALCEFEFDTTGRQWVAKTDGDGRTSVPGVYVAGDGARILGADAAEMSGSLVARAALTDLGIAGKTGSATSDALRRRLGAQRRFRRGLEDAFPWPAHLAKALPDETIVCRCERITAGELRSTARERGATEVNRVKALNRVGMGRCQGRFCGLAVAEIVAAALSVPVEQVGRLRGQAPVKPLPLAAAREWS